VHILIEGISTKLKEEDLKPVFEEYGKVTNVKMVISNITKLNKGFAYIIMPEEAEALAAIEALNGKEMDGKTITVVKSPVTADEGIKQALRHGSTRAGNTKNFSTKSAGPSKGFSGGGPKASIPKGGSSRGK
jgi:RNA recognition motif-containing protein